MASSSPPPPRITSKIFQWSQLNLHSYSRRGLLLLLIFFFLLIFIATLFLTAHWICSHRRRRRSSSAAAASSDGLDPDFVKSLPVILNVTDRRGKRVVDFVEEISECSICLGVFEEEEMLKVLPECKHAYHSECVDKWLSCQSSCPLCRTSLTPIISP